MSEKLTREQKLYNLSYLIKLASAAVDETQPPEPTEEIDFNYIYRVCKAHDIANTVFYTVEKLQSKPEEKLLKKWRDERNKGVHRNMIQSMEADALKETFNENGIDFMPVKGFPVCALYPKPDYRYMGDLDYLIRPEDLQKAGALIKNMGYMPDHIGQFHHDEYIKPPLMVLELHHSMVKASSQFSDYYKGFLDKGKNIGGHEYKMSDEDLYIFLIVHLFKHYEESGTGIRSFMDMYLVNKKMLPKLNHEYIDAELEKLGLTEFCEFIYRISSKWFVDGNVDKFSEEEIYILTSGAYGSARHKYENRIKGKKKSKAILERIFPPVSWMKDTYPILKKSMLFLPFTYVHRMVFKSIKNRKKIKDELHTFKETKS
ncbi:MAG: nucleotidyltransferase family protein [Ruminococcus sp.]|nr:nucleotidyltransferase family protein [Ruminococcus sp.]